MFIVSIPTIARWPAWLRWLGDMILHAKMVQRRIFVLFNIFDKDIFNVCCVLVCITVFCVCVCVCVISLPFHVSSFWGAK